MNRGIIGVIIGVLVIIILGDHHSSAHLTADPGRAKRVSGAALWAAFPTSTPGRRRS